MAVVCAQRIEASTRETQRRAVAGGQSNRRSARIGAGLRWESERSIVVNEASNDRGAKGP